MLARLERTNDEAMRGLDATHAFDHQLNLGVRDDLFDIRRHSGIRKAIGQLENALYLHRGHALAYDVIDASTYRSMTQKTDLHIKPRFLECFHAPYAQTSSMILA